jgi:hypothetical protein
MFNSVIFNEEVFAPGASQAASPAWAKAHAHTPHLFCWCSIILEDKILVGTAAIASAFVPKSIGGSDVNATTAAATASCWVPYINIGGHAIVKAQYFDTPVQLNRMYLIGIDDKGNPLYAEAKNNTAISLYGEKLRIVPEPMVSTRAVGLDVSTNMLNGIRLRDHRGSIHIQPNCGIEMWDVVEIDDETCNQSHTKYRVGGYRLRYEAKSATFLHEVNLVGV